MNITRDEIKKFRTEFENAMKPLETKYNMKINLGSISFSQLEFHTKMTCTNLDEKGEKRVDEKFFDIMKDFLGFEGNLGDSYRGLNGITYTIVDLDSKKHKYPVIIKGSDGKQYKNTVASVNAMLKRYGVAK